MENIELKIIVPNDYDASKVKLTEGQKPEIIKQKYMNAIELRLGNVAEHKGKTQRVTHIEPAEISLNFFVEIDVAEINPVLLTEEWLIKLGFNNKEIKAYFVKDAFRLENYKGTWTTFYKGSYLMECIYVHQLQNVCFAITNEELVLTS